MSKNNNSNYDYTNLYQGTRKYKNLRAQVKGNYKELLKKYVYIRIPLAIILILVLLFMTGIVSDLFADRGNYKTAKNILLFPTWMETYYPDKLAYYNAGILYQDCKYDEAYEALSEIEDYSKSESMMQMCILSKSRDLLNQGKLDESINTFLEIDNSKILYINQKEYSNFLQELIDTVQDLSGYNEILDKLDNMKIQSA